MADDVTLPGTGDVIAAVSGALTYVGKAAPGASPSAAVWQIARLDETTADISLKYADGVASFSKVWDSRASYAY